MVVKTSSGSLKKTLKKWLSKGLVNRYMPSESKCRRTGRCVNCWATFVHPPKPHQCSRWTMNCCRAWSRIGGRHAPCGIFHTTAWQSMACGAEHLRRQPSPTGWRPLPWRSAGWRQLGRAGQRNDGMGRKTHELQNHRLGRYPSVKKTQKNM